ncbi:MULTISPECIES: ribbon-helix-helix protein, CopG family [Pseudomonas]|uniref:ribbon-helix-helix protein, CopG family n=1 Tax=Pseudomonas TaxID=286 RepID=UPI000C99BB83|nr:MULTISPECIES: ribbon-helix-helix protein, CopG family [Pseudomonas]MDH0131744.1 ribbon-helix-helix protein, CopG family [Pseudomonas asiatica]PNG87697.1 Bifunctional protein PutA [Pseudomonas putida]QNV67944.1 ribbon-helix-helix protein, CopG family [Pseudomonas sp. CFA]
MSSTTTGIKLDSPTKERIKEAADLLDRTPHWFMKKAVMYWLERVEAGASVADMLSETDLNDDDQRNSVQNRQRLLSVD